MAELRRILAPEPPPVLPSPTVLARPQELYQYLQKLWDYVRRLNQSMASAVASGALDGEDGAPGADGADGQDGADGADGAPGAPGADGSDGILACVGVDCDGSQANGATVNIATDLEGVAFSVSVTYQFNLGGSSDTIDNTNSAALNGNGPIHRYYSAGWSSGPETLMTHAGTGGGFSIKYNAGTLYIESTTNGGAPWFAAVIVVGNTPSRVALT